MALTAICYRHQSCLCRPALLHVCGDLVTRLFIYLIMTTFATSTMLESTAVSRSLNQPRTNGRWFHSAFVSYSVTARCFLIGNTHRLLLVHVLCCLWSPDDPGSFASAAGVLLGICSDRNGTWFQSTAIIEYRFVPFPSASCCLLQQHRQSGVMYRCLRGC